MTVFIGSITSVPPIIASGITYLPMTPAEAMVVNAMRLLVQQGDGSMYLEFRRDQQGRTLCTKWDVNPNVGGAKAINAVLGQTLLRD